MFLQKIKNSHNLIFLSIVVILIVPTFWRMLRPGIFSMQDPVHYFRLVDYYKCFEDWNFPCRWSPSSGLGYGEPVFNFYGQLPYFVGGLFHLAGFPFIDSLKLLFILSLVGSGVSMFFLAKHFWKDDWVALVSSIVYVYAPYRALDVWVRGALPEALAFVLFPLVLLEFDRFIEEKSKVHLLAFSLLVALLITTHNLSLVLFLPVLIFWTIFKIKKVVKNLLWLKLLGAGILSFLISSFYVLPLIFESKYVNLASTTTGYFDFRGHFASLHQLLFSRFWGYGASLFQATDMSRSVGQAQWTLPIISIVILSYCYIVKKIHGLRITVHESLILFLTGWFFLFLIHNKSTFLWQVIPAMAYIQFPWRFLGMATFCFALVSGVFPLLFSKYIKLVALIVIVIVISLNFGFFKEDIWRNVSDKDLQTGNNWEEMQRASIADFWPKSSGLIPVSPAPQTTNFGSVIYENSYRVIFELAKPISGKVEVPINYFPGWQAYNNNKLLTTSYTKNGLISVIVDKDVSKIQLFFENTLVRRIGNILSLFGTMAFGYISLNYSEKKKI
jgi:hypothetical protein